MRPVQVEKEKAQPERFQERVGDSLRGQADPEAEQAKGNETYLVDAMFVLVFQTCFGPW